MSRQKLEAQIEKQLHKFLTEVVEHAIDFTVLSARKKFPNADKAEIIKLLELVRSGSDDGFLQGVDRFMKKLDAALVEYTDEESPLKK